MERLKIGVALSGGVDSTATALMLRQDYNLTGFFMQLAQPNIEAETEKVRQTAAKLDIPLQVIDLREPFRSHILRYFSDSYCRGRTPNPCMVCNTAIKFGLFLKAMLAYGMDKMATGHYARLRCEKGIYHLLKGRDRRKDQSYFLARLSQQQLQRVIFPLGEMEKKDIFTYVEEQGFPSFKGKESQDVCFLENTSVAAYLQQAHASASSFGPIVDISGKVLGTHNGIYKYTIGQRRGLGISAPVPYYVIQIDGANNRIVVGEDKALYQKMLLLGDLNWLSGASPKDETHFTVKIRYTHKGGEAKLDILDDNRAQIIFSEAQRAVAPGQFAVLYSGDEVIGSGEIGAQKRATEEDL